MNYSLNDTLIMSLLASTLTFGSVQAGQSDHSQHEHHKQARKEATTRSEASVELLDRVLSDQHGRRLNFRDEAVKERIMVIGFIYTSCTTVCPVVSALFSQVQQKLAERLGDEVGLLSLTLDPVTDTPQRLHAYSARYGASPDWLWLTGDKATVDEVLTGLGAYTANFEDHPAMMLVGDAATNRWTRFFGFTDPAKLIAEVDRLAELRQVSLLHDHQGKHHD